MRLEFLRPFHVLRGLCADHFFGFGVFLPFEGEHEEFEGLVVELICFFVLAGLVVVDGAFYDVDGAAEEVGVGHGWWCLGRYVRRGGFE